MVKSELVFVPSPLVGHLISSLELAKLLVNRDPNLSITLLIIHSPKYSTITSDSMRRKLERIQFIDLPITLSDPNLPLITYIETHKPQVKEAVLTRFARPDSPRLVGFVLDMFCASMIDVADEVGVPSYIFFTSGAAYLSLMFHAQYLNDELGKSMSTYEFDKDSDVELVVPGFQNPFQIRYLPTSYLKKERFHVLCETVRRYWRAKGIMVNTFTELESHAFNAFVHLPLYPVGPILSLERKKDGDEKKSEIIGWLDGQPDSSVVFLCFGSLGSFGVDQVKEIAFALEKGGYRFLWSLRKLTSNTNNGAEITGDYDDFKNVLPEGFLDRTAGIGKVIGWAPQVDILAHSSTGGFVSHCGWNSVLESVWFGVPIATWPMYAEQQANAFQLVKELGIGVEIKMDYRKDFNSHDAETIVKADDIDRGIKDLMENGVQVRNRMKEMSVASRNAFTEGRTSFSSLGRFISDVKDWIKLTNSNTEN